MNIGNNQQPQAPKSSQIDEQDAKEIKTSQKLVITASILGPVSMIIGGMPLGLAAIICAAIALTKIHKLIKKADPAKLIAIRLRTACIVALVVSVIAFILNAISFVLVFPILMEAIETGDYSSILPQNGSLPGGGENSTWG